MSKDYENIRPEALTDEVKQLVANELGQLAAARDVEVGRMVGGSMNVAGHNAQNPQFLAVLGEIFGIQSQQAEKATTVAPTQQSRGSFARI